MEYLGFWVTRDGVKPTNRKTEAMNNINSTTSQKKIQRFIGAVN